MVIENESIELFVIFTIAILGMGYLIFEYIRTRKSIKLEEKLGAELIEKERQSKKFSHSEAEKLIEKLKGNKYFTKIALNEDNIALEHQHTWTIARCFITSNGEIIKSELSLRFGNCTLMGIALASGAANHPPSNMALFWFFFMYLLLQYKTRPEDIEHEYKKFMKSFEEGEKVL